MIHHSNETYKHSLAKVALKSQLFRGMYNYKPLRIDFEVKFVINACWLFVSDVCVYEKDGLSAIFEIVVTNPISASKWQKMEYYFQQQGFRPDIIEIDADEILKKLIWKKS